FDFVVGQDEAVDPIILQKRAFDASVSNVGHEDGIHGVASCGTVRSVAITRLTNPASPCPVTADIGMISMPRWASISMRTCSLSVNSDLLRATTSGFAARSGL